MANDLIVRILGDSRSLERSFQRSSTAAKNFETQTTSTLGRVDKSFSKLQRVAAGGFLGGVAATAGIQAFKALNSAATESQQVLGQTQVALESTGKSWDKYGDQIQDAIAKQSRLGFDDEALFRTFSLFVRQSHDVGEALRRNSIAMNLARARFIDLEQAAQLVNKAALGQAGALRRVGIDARNGASGVELLAKLEEQFAGSAEKASTQAVGAQDRLKVSIENTEEALGTLLLPTVTEFANATADAADMVTKLVGELGKLGQIKIPTITIPFVTKQIGGGTLGGKVAKIAGFAALNQLSPAAAIAVGVKRLVDKIKGEPPPNTAAAAKAFDDKFDGFVDTLKKTVNTSTEKANKKLAAFGQAGFKALETNPLGEALQNAFDSSLESLDLKFDRAEFQGNQAAALAALADEEAAIRKRMETVGRTTELERKLLTIEQQRKGILDANKVAAKQAADAAKDAAKEQARRAREAANAAKAAAKSAQQERQFKALGLDPSGGDRVPTIKNLKKQLEQLELNPKLTNKQGSQLANIGRVLGGAFGDAKEPVRAKIKELFDAIREELNKGSEKVANSVKQGPLTKTQGLNADKVLAGLGLSPEQQREARARLSSVNTAGRSLAGDRRPTGGFTTAGAVVIQNETTVNLDGERVGRSVTKTQQKNRRRNPKQKSGPNSGV